MHLSKTGIEMFEIMQSSLRICLYYGKEVLNPFCLYSFCGTSKSTDGTDPRLKITHMYVKQT
jgi:hypothetical protein